jgi:glycosyltransferase involved in cell wall biosynthesis
MDVLYRPGHFATKTTLMAAALIRRISEGFSLRQYDAILIHRAACLVGPAFIERLIAMLGRPILFDFDDAIHLLDTSAANRRFGWLKFPSKTAALCKLSTHVVVGNTYLAEYARLRNPNVTVIPSSVDTRFYQPQPKKKPEGRIIVGWTGSTTSLNHLEMFAPVLRDLIALNDVEIRVHTDRQPVLPGVPFVWSRWSAETEVEEISKFDIGIMPLPDNQWTRGKCAMKALLYMALGIPAVCSAVGANSELIEHGENGLLSATPEEWLANIGVLVNDSSLRERLGRAGRQTVEERYSMEKSASLFAKAIRQTIQGRELALNADGALIDV